MSDLVERLLLDSEVRLEAAAEIQRLREELRLCIHVDKHIHITSGLNIEIERLRAEIESLRDQIVKHNLSIKEAIRRGKAFEWKTLTLDS